MFLDSETFYKIKKIFKSPKNLSLLFTKKKIISEKLVLFLNTFDF